MRPNALRQMLEAVVERREAIAATVPDDSPLEVITFTAMPPPRWRSRMEHAAEDGVMESLYASIREEGWRAFAEGGLEAMHRLAELACGDHDGLSSILDHRWDGIGTDKGGYWVA